MDRVESAGDLLLRRFSVAIKFVIISVSRLSLRSVRRPSVRRSGSLRSVVVAYVTYEECLSTMAAPLHRSLAARVP